MVDTYSAREEKVLMCATLLNLVQMDSMLDENEPLDTKPADNRSWSAAELLEERDKLILGDFKISDYNASDSEKAYHLLLNMFSNAQTTSDKDKKPKSKSKVKQPSDSGTTGKGKKNLNF